MSKKYLHKKAITISAAFVLALLFVPGLANAKDGESSGSGSSGSGKTTTVTTERTVKTETKTPETESETETEPATGDDSTATGGVETTHVTREERRQIAKEKLSAVKLKVCQQHETQVNNTMDRVVTRSQRHIDRITAVADKAKAFYIKQGNVLGTYDTLVANVETARVAAQAATDALTTTATFSCDSDGPKSEIQDFRNQRLNKIDAVGAYRTAVKALIAGIKSVQPDTSATTTDTPSTEVKQ
jgi:hypothetical protein